MMFRRLLMFHAIAALPLAGAPAAAGSGVALQVTGLPADPSKIVWERLPLLPSERITVFRGVENVSAFNHHPTIAWHDGRFFAAWSSGDRDEDAPGQRILYATSVDGRTWPTAVSLADAVPDHGYTPGGFWIRDGDIYALASLRSSRGATRESEYELLAYRWDKAKAAFVQPVRVARNFFSNDGPRRTAGGQWLMLGKSQAPAARVAARVARGGVDSLDAWTFGTLPGATIAHDTFWCALADGRLVAIEAAGRPPERRLVAMFSGDSGATWSDPLPSNFPDADSRLHGLQLSNGYHVLLNNPNPSRYRIPLSLALSRDGLQYDRIANVRIEQTNKKYSGHAKAPGYQYARGMEHDGRLWTIYSVNKEDIEISTITLHEIERLAKSEEAYPTHDLGPEVIVDNRDSRFASHRPWPTSREAPGYHGLDYAYLPADTAGWAKWSVVAPEAGAYRLYLRWTTIGFSQKSPMEDIAPLEIRHPGGVDRTTVDQTRYGGTWVCLGVHPLQAGETIEVKITAGGDGITVADAIKLVRIASDPVR